MSYVFSLRGIEGIAEKFLGKSLHRSAAALSYFLTMTIFPTLICIQWLLGTLGEDILTFLEDFSELIPASAFEVFEDYLSYTGTHSTTLLSVGIIMAIYTGASAYRMLFDLLRGIFKSSGGNSVLRFLLSFLWAGVFLVFIYICATVMLAGRWLINVLTPFFKKISFINLLDLAQLWSWFRFILLIIISIAMLFVIYYTAQWRSPYRSHVLPGAVSASLLLTAVSFVFSEFISISVNYSLIYGSLASIIILMFWLYLLGNIIIIGALINQTLKEHSGDPSVKIHSDVKKFIKGKE